MIYAVAALPFFLFTSCLWRVFYFQSKPFSLRKFSFPCLIVVFLLPHPLLMFSFCACVSWGRSRRINGISLNHIQPALRGIGAMDSWVFCEKIMAFFPKIKHSNWRCFLFWWQIVPHFPTKKTYWQWQYRQPGPGAHQMEPPSPIQALGVNSYRVEL